MKRLAKCLEDGLREYSIHRAGIINKIEVSGPPVGFSIIENPSLL